MLEKLKTILKRIWKATAAAVVAGAAIATAFFSSWFQEDMTCRELAYATRHLRDPQQYESFFLGVADGADIPEAKGDYLLGACGNGGCIIPSDVCPESPPIVYNYDCGPSISGWRVCRVKAHPKIATGWYKVAQDDSNFRWYQSLGQVITECLNNYTKAQCLELLEADKHCWLIDDDEFCRHGYLYGPGQGGETACPYARVIKAMPCEVMRGAGSERIDANKEWTTNEDGELIINEGS